MLGPTHHYHEYNSIGAHAIADDIQAAFILDDSRRSLKREVQVPPGARRVALRLPATAAAAIDRCGEDHPHAASRCAIAANTSSRPSTLRWLSQP